MEGYLRQRAKAPHSREGVANGAPGRKAAVGRRRAASPVDRLADLGATQSAFPEFIEPCHPTLKKRPPDGSEWVHEIKLDGYRAQLHINGGKITIYTRTGLDWTKEFKAVATAAEALAGYDVVMDGEVTVFGNTGLPDFQALRRELAKRSSPHLTFQAFDLLYLDGYDLRRVPLIERKRVLRELIGDAAGTIAYVDYLELEEGEPVYLHACKMGLEGIVSKRKDAPYRSGRQEIWTKTKCTKRDAFPIVAFVEKLGAHPRRIASLYLGRWEGDRLVYAGKAQTGYTLTAAREVRERLNPFIIGKNPLSHPINKPKATWIEPQVFAEIDYGGVTDDGLLREPVFKGLQDVPRDAGKRRPVARPASIRVPRENILQLLPDAVVPSKEELADYWTRVADRALLFLGGRPLKLVRHIHGTTFYHKGPLPPIPPAVHQLRIEKREGGAGVRLWVDDLAGLLGLVEIGAVELHPWAATVDDIEHADALIFDLDPGEGVSWEFVVETALLLREFLEAEGFKTWPKLTGGKGVHLMAPLAAKMTHNAAHACAKRLAQQFASTDPDRYVTSAQLSQRPGKLFLDYLRNGRGTTAVGTYSPRARSEFPVAAPATWRDIERGIRPDAFTIKRPRKRRKVL
ncbi:DNA ligase D [Sinorhizobium meliloti]|nr:DNA ligase D [Sinorhizobium meliloti]MDW9511257.1 DNA ligase D [Sinorhizobium meliloti]MDW9921693.1 DNA ligase D [Sinorhizobium meliloti]MDW9926000.1 DNA ligase D [Sinorhizobium meliloti]MDX0032839.1 DNA ligase D [Sinorhizobium meliloti]